MDDPTTVTSHLPQILGVMVPIIAVTLGLATAMLGMWLDFRKKREMYQLYHAERMAAIDKGIELPPLPTEFFGRTKEDATPFAYLRRGLLWCLGGGGLVLAIWGEGDIHLLWVLLPVGAGLSQLICYFYLRKRKS